jgi:hypothetical protein
MNFKEWLLQEGTNPGAKTGLYPLGYGGIGLYPPQWYPTRSADAIFYMSIDERIYKGKDGGSFNIEHIPGDPPKTMNKGDKGIWDISHIKGKPSHPIQKNYAANNGEDKLWNIKNLKGNVTYKKNKEFIPDAGDKGGIWDISKIK